MRRTWPAVVVLSVVSVPAAGRAQPAPAALFAREASLSVGLGHVFRYEDQTFGDRLNVGGSLGIVHRSGVGVEFETAPTPALDQIWAQVFGCLFPGQYRSIRKSGGWTRHGCRGRTWL